MTVERVRVGDVLALQRREVAVEPDEFYTLIGVYSFGKGIFHRDPKRGSELGDYRFFSVVPGDLVLSNIQAWEGAIAYATESDRGAIGTHRFLSYVPRDGRIDTNWARWFFLSEPGMDLIRMAAPGTTIRNRTLAIERFEALEIPLPPIDEQRRVASRIDAVAAQSEELQRVSAGRVARASAYVQSWLDSRLRAVGASAVLSDVADVHRGRGPRYEPGSGFIAVNQACVRWGGVDLGRAREVEQAWWEGTPPTAAVEMGDVLVNSTGEGTIGRAAVADAGCVGTPIDSHVMIVRSRSDGPLLPEFLEAYLRSAGGQAQVEAAKGANTTKQTELGKAKLERFVVPLPSRNEQRVFIASYLEMLDAVGALQAEFARSDAVLKAIRPSALNDAFADLS